MFESISHNGQVIGHICRSPNYGIFFSNRFGSLEILQQVFHQWDFLGLNQVHSCNWVAANSEPAQADAHFTQKTNQALFIKTADCLPIMITAPSFVAAIHAGWRGIHGGIIVSKNGTELLSMEHAQAFVGPHIGKGSFEVGNDLVEKLAKSPGLGDSPSSDFCMDHPDSNKSYVNLAHIAIRQLEHTGVKEIHQFERNTFSDPEYHSYRRDGAAAGRQISFVVRF